MKNVKDLIKRHEKNGGSKMKLRRYTKTTYNNVAYEFGNVMEYDSYYISMYNKMDDKCIKYEWGG